MTPEEQAKLLAAWLERTPEHDDPEVRPERVADPPEGVDDDVIEAIYALRPDLAPPPRIDLDDILGSLTEGPLAAVGAVPAPEPVAEPIQERVAAVVPFAPTPSTARPRGRRWLAPTAATGTMLAMAAALLLTVLVYQGGAPEPATAVYEPYAPRAGLDRAPVATSEPEDDARKPDGARVQEEATEVPSWSDGDTEKKGKLSEDPAAVAARDQIATTGYIASGEADDDAMEALTPLSASLTSDEKALDQGLLAKEDLTSTFGAAGTGGGAPVAEGTARSDRQVDAPPAVADPAVAAPEPSPPPARVATTPRPRPASNGEPVAMARPSPAPVASPSPAPTLRPTPMDAGAQAAGPPPATHTKPSGSTGSASTTTAPERPAREVRAAETERPAEPEVAVADLEELDDVAGQAAGADASVDGRMEQTTAEVVTVERRRGFSLGSRKSKSPSAGEDGAVFDAPRLDLALLRRSALPSELAPTWPSTTVSATIDDNVDEGQKDTARSADATLMEAARATRSWLDARAFAQAADAAEAGLSLPVGPTPERSMLLVLYGDALAGLGDPYGAAEAYEAARQANDARRRRPVLDAAPATTSE